MKRGKNRGRTSSLGLRKDMPSDDFSSQLIPGILDSKWQEIQEQDERDNLILEIREEIINECLEICYHKYLNKQVVTFTVHCSYLAWLKIIDLHFLRHDPGDSNWQNTPNWQPDEEMKPSELDTWASKALKLLHDTGPPHTKPHATLSHSSLLPEKDAELEALEIVPNFSTRASEKELPSRDISQKLSVAISETRSLVSDGTQLGRSQGSSLLAAKLSSIMNSMSLAKVVQKAIVESHPSVVPSRYSLRHKRSSLHQKFSTSYSFVPDLISPASLPASRIEVSYAIAPTESKVRSSVSKRLPSGGRFI